MHIHVILSGNSMHSMMDNHLDIGIIAELAGMDTLLKVIL
jgi:hypothetical protein